MALFYLPIFCQFILLAIFSCPILVNTNNESHSLVHRGFDGREVIEVNFRVFGQVYNEQRQKYKNCGGTLISSRHFLTAAHCFFDPEQVCQPDYEGTLADSLAQDQMTPEWKGKPFTLERARLDLDGLCLPNKFCDLDRCACLPPKLTRQVGVNRAFIPTAFLQSRCAIGDIALVELAQEVAPRKVQLARWSTPLSHPLYASGYGYDPSMHLTRNPDLLMTANVSVLPWDQCPEEHKLADAICADELAIDQNVCQGDSGAGLRDLDANIFGIVAFGTPCDVIANDDQQDLPREKRNYEGAVYTNVTYHLPFICGIVSPLKVEGCLPEDLERAKEQPYFEIARNGQISGQIARFEKKETSGNNSR